MELTILGSGGAIPTPRLFCHCEVCEKARRLGEPFRRNGSSLFIHDSNTLIDCGEDIGDTLERRKINCVENLFITHWHPDHTFGLRPLLEAHYNFREQRANKAVNVYIPKKVFEDLKAHFPAIEYFLNSEKTGKLHLIEDGDKIDFGSTSITAIGYAGIGSSAYAYLLEGNGKRVLYSPCDTKGFESYKNQKNLDFWITECGLFSSFHTEISFDELIARIKEIKPGRAIITHLEEIEVQMFGEDYLEKMKRKYASLNVDFAFDGMKIKA